MNRDTQTDTAQKRRLWQTPIFWATFSIILMVLMGPVQDTGDDAMTAWQLSRGIGSLASFISPFLSLALSAFYEFVPQLAWWSICLALGGWATLLVGYQMIMKRYQGFYRYYFAVAWFFIVWIAVMQKMNFTRTGIAFALAGGLLIAQTVLYPQSKGKKIAGYIGGLLLFLLGSMVRFQAALVAVPYLLAILVCFCLKENSYKLKGLICVRNLLRGVAIMVPVVIALVIFQCESAFWNANPQWKEYKEFNRSRSEIIDYAAEYPSWETGAEQYRAIGLEQQDIELMFDYAYLGDTDVYTLDTMHKIEMLRGAEATKPVKIYQAALKMLDILQEGKIFWYILVMGIFFFLAFGNDIWLPFLATGAGSLILLTHFCYSGRIMLRVWEPLMMCFVAVLLFLFENRIKPEAKWEYSFLFLRSGATREKSLAKLLINDKILLVTISMILVFSWGLAQPLTALNMPVAETDRDTTARKRADYIDAHRENLYLLAVPLIHHSPNPGYFGLWEGIPKDYCTNYFALGNWDARTPTNLNRFAAVGIDNPTKALIERTDVYSDYNYALHTFLQLHYGEDITCSAVGRYEDESAIVQYTKHIASSRISGNTKAEISWKTSQYVSDYGRDAWLFEGTVDMMDLTRYQAVYCNLVIDGIETTYRLGITGEGGFYACMYGVPETYGEGDSIATIFALQQDESYLGLGTIPLVFR